MLIPTYTLLFTLSLLFGMPSYLLYEKNNLKKSKCLATTTTKSINYDSSTHRNIAQEIQVLILEVKLPKFLPFPKIV